MRFSPDGVSCRYCPHDSSRHLCTSGQPHFFRKATPEEERDPFLTLYRHNVPGGPVLVRRMVVARDAELITAFCRTCARELGPTRSSAHQVLCFQRRTLDCCAAGHSAVTGERGGGSSTTGCGGDRLHGATERKEIP